MSQKYILADKCESKLLKHKKIDNLKNVHVILPEENVISKHAIIRRKVNEAVIIAMYVVYETNSDFIFINITIGHALHYL